MSILESINQQRLKTLSEAELSQLAGEIREYIIECVSHNGGHLASNLGVVELTIALHRTLDLPEDKLLWDVGHQTYVHKILTGRKERLRNLRVKDGISGFPKRGESEYDCYETGHSSTALSAAMGMAHARDIKGESYCIAAVVGDGSLTGGMSFEALNDIGRLMSRLVIIINDNEMSISKNVGAFAAHLNKVRSGSSYNRIKDGVLSQVERFPAVTHFMRRVKQRVKYLLLPSVLFEELGFKYYGPIDGHNIELMEYYLQQAKKLSRPVVIHMHTRKGKGYAPAESNPNLFHGIGKFNKETGEPVNGNSLTNSQIMGEALVELAQRNPTIVAVTAAMATGTGLEEFAARYSKRFFDVGIAEQHAVGVCAGLAMSGMRPIFAVYSSFLQRAYDQIYEDVCLQKLPVVFAIDRCGLVGEDGATHHGIYDISYMLDMPGICIFSPATQQELRAMLVLAFDLNCPVAIRYPRKLLPQGEQQEIKLGEWQMFGALQPVMIVSTGGMLGACMGAAEIVRRRGHACGVVHARFIKPMDETVLNTLKGCTLIYTVEDGIVSRGLGGAIDRELSGSAARVINLGLPEEPVQFGGMDELYEQVGLNESGIAKEILEALR